MSNKTRVQWIDLEALVVGRIDATGQGALTVNTNRTVMAGFLTALSEAAHKAADAWVQWQTVRRTEAQLRNCSDAVLKDIGIHRSEISSLAVGAKERRRANLDLRPQRDRF